MSTPKLVEAFYERLWNTGEFEALVSLLSKDFVFRGSLGRELQGQEDFADYVRSVRTALSNYNCEILECVSEGARAFAKMRFSGIHTGDFRGYPPSGLLVYWLGAAMFRFEAHKIAELWVLGDLAGLDALLEENKKRSN